MSSYLEHLNILGKGSFLIDLIIKKDYSIFMFYFKSILLDQRLLQMNFASSK